MACLDKSVKCKLFFLISIIIEFFFAKKIYRMLQCHLNAYINYTTQYEVTQTMIKSWNSQATVLQGLTPI